MMYASASIDTYGNATLQDFQGWFAHEPTQTSPYLNTANYDSNNDTFNYTYGYLNYDIFIIKKMLFGEEPTNTNFFKRKTFSHRQDQPSCSF